jgi:hypothetical protein
VTRKVVDRTYLIQAIRIALVFLITLGHLSIILLWIFFFLVLILLLLQSSGLFLPSPLNLFIINPFQTSLYRPTTSDDLSPKALVRAVISRTRSVAGHEPVFVLVAVGRGGGWRGEEVRGEAGEMGEGLAGRRGWTEGVGEGVGGRDWDGKVAEVTWWWLRSLRRGGGRGEDGLELPVLLWGELDYETSEQSARLRGLSVRREGTRRLTIIHLDGLPLLFSTQSLAIDSFEVLHDINSLP